MFFGSLVPALHFSSAPDPAPLWHLVAQRSGFCPLTDKGTGLIPGQGTKLLLAAQNGKKAKQNKLRMHPSPDICV